VKILFVSSGKETICGSNLVSSQAKSLIALNIRVESYYVRGNGIVGYLKNVFPLKRLLRDNQYNIIHAHYGLSGWVALLAKKKKAKLIISFMGNDLLGDHARKGKSTFKGNFLVRLNQHFAKYADYIIIKSSEMSDKVLLNNKSIIPNGVNLDNFFSLERNLALKKVGWDPQFRHVLFMSNPERPEKNFALATTAIRNLEIEGVQLHNLNQIPHEDMVYYYNASDICLLTSFHEGSPNVIKEAMSCDIPIVSTNVGDVKEVFGNTQGCYICSFNPTDVREKLEMALEFAHTIGRTNGRNRIIELCLDTESIAKKLVEVYKRVICQ
jgi:teichuronic acid biosynthesis glycosyltransferase TuaC